MARDEIETLPERSPLRRAIGVVREQLLPSANEAWLALAAALLVGFALRVLLSPGTPLHENNHGIETIRGLVECSWGAERHDPYGNTFFLVMNGLLSIFGRHEATLFLINRVIGSLSVLGIYMLAKSLRFSELGALSAALLLCVSPSQVWISGTESPMVPHLFLALAGLAVLIAAIRASDPLLTWSATVLIALASSMHVSTVPSAPAAVGFALWAGLSRAMRESRSYRRHVYACLAFGAACVSLHAYSLNRDSLAKGVSWLSVADNLSVWASVRNIVWDPTLTPVVVPPLMLIGLFLLLRRRRDLALPLAGAAVLLIPLSFTVCTCRSDAVRYQSPMHWIYYLLAALPFSGVLTAPARALRLSAWGAILLLGATSAPGLFLLEKGNENSEEYRFMRDVAAAVPPHATIWLPTNAPADRLRTEFPDYLHEQFLIKGDAPDPFPRPAARWLYVGLDCYKRESPEDELDPSTGRRRECESACAGARELVLEKTLDARRPRWGFQQPFFPLSTERPVVGLYRCASAPLPPRRTGGCSAQARIDSDVLRLAAREYRETASASLASGILAGLDGTCGHADLLLDFAEEAAHAGRWEDERSALLLARELKPNAEKARRLDEHLAVLDSLDATDRVRGWVERLRSAGLPVPTLLRRAGLRDIARARRFKLSSEQLGWFAIACQDLEDYAQSAQILDALVRENPSEARWRGERGVLRSLMGNPDGAVVDFNAAIGLEPGLLESYLSLGSLYASMRRRQDALDVFQKGLSRARAHGDEKTARRILAARAELASARS